MQQQQTEEANASAALLISLTSKTWFIMA